MLPSPKISVSSCHAGGRYLEKRKVIASVCFKDVGIHLTVCVITNSHIFAILNDVFIGNEMA